MRYFDFFSRTFSLMIFGLLWSNRQSNQSNQSHEKYSWNFYSRLDLSLWIIFFCSCVLGEGLDEGMDILHEMILSNRRRRRQNASNHIGPPKPQRRKVRRSQSTYHWQSTMGSMFLWISILILSVVRQLSGSCQAVIWCRQNTYSNHGGPPKPQRQTIDSPPTMGSKPFWNFIWICMF